MDAELEKLEVPPVVEVVCGVVFPPIPQLSPLSLGTFWVGMRAEYPTHSLMPVISDEPSLVFGGISPLRTWFLSADDQFVIQVQQDRFYLNWRARLSEYPRFSDHGDARGLLSRFLTEFGNFCVFARQNLDATPEPHHIELTKVDHLLEGEHWTDTADLGAMVPSLAGFLRLSSSNATTIGVRVSDQTTDATLSVAIDSAIAQKTDGTKANVLKLETRLSAATGPDLDRAFKAANKRVNSVFSSLIPVDERRNRFAKRGKL